MGNMSKAYAEGTALYPQFRSVTDEILWLQPDADLGYSISNPQVTSKTSTKATNGFLSLSP